MRILLIITIIIISIIASIALLNVFTLFDEGQCGYSPNLGMCVLKEYADIESNGEKGVIDGGQYSCKMMFEKCTRIPKYLDFQTYIRVSR